jgi:hypothetical protein
MDTWFDIGVKREQLFCETTKKTAKKARGLDKNKANE